MAWVILQSISINRANKKGTVAVPFIFTVNALVRASIDLNDRACVLIVIHAINFEAKQLEEFMLVAFVV